MGVGVAAAMGNGVDGVDGEMGQVNGYGTGNGSRSKSGGNGSDGATAATTTTATTTTTPAPHHASPSFTSTAFLRTPCTCPETVWLCQPCGLALRGADTSYMRAWTWRTRYSTYLGGLGTGIGEGVEGVQCGREDRCLAASEIETEIDCSADELDALQGLGGREDGVGEGDDNDAAATMAAAAMATATATGTTDGEDHDHDHDRAGPSYLLQVFEGAGGVVSRKFRRRMRVGAVVREFEDERESGTFLGREKAGVARSWCAWCDRVVPGERDRTGGGDRPGSSGSEGEGV